jgi:hypothetical protein
MFYDIYLYTLCYYICCLLGACMRCTRLCPLKSGVTIRFWTVRVSRADSLNYQGMNRPPSLCGPSATCIYVRKRQLNGHFHPLLSPLTLSTRLKETLVDCERTMKRTCARTVRKLVGSSTIMYSSQYFKISWILSDFFRFGDSSDFLSDLELSSGFTNMIGGIANVTHCECCAKI